MAKKQYTRKRKVTVIYPIIHVAGTQGSGKSTLGTILLKRYNSKIHVCDLDNLFNDFSKQIIIKDFQSYINSFIIEHRDKPLIFVGLDAELCLGTMKDSGVYYNLQSNYNYYIATSENTLKQRFTRQIDKLYTRKEYFFSEWLKDPEEIQQKLFRFVDLNKWVENNKKCDELYLKRGYKFMSSDDILLDIVSCL